MNRARWLILGCLLVGGELSALAADPLQIAPQDGMLLLRTGNVLRGKVSRSSDRFVVALPDGEIRVKAAEVELFCRDLDEAYAIKAKAIDGAGAAEHLDLAEWCLQHELFGYAARELMRAQTAEPEHPRIALVDRRLQLAINPIARPKTDAPAAPARAKSTELNQLVRGLPTRSVEVFTGTIQPLLINRCATAACHGPGSNHTLSLERIPSGRPITHRITQRNLSAALECIDRNDPASSLLLVVPLTAHGGMTQPVFTQHDLAKYQQLVEWVNGVSTHDAPPQPATVRQPANPLLQTMADGAASNVTPEELLGGAESTDDASEKTPASAATPWTTKDIRGKRPTVRRPPQRGAAAQTPAPVTPPAAQDPFDPEIFNRQFHDGE